MTVVSDAESNAVVGRFLYLLGGIAATLAVSGSGAAAATASRNLTGYMFAQIVFRDPVVKPYIEQMQLTAGHVVAVDGTPEVVGRDLTIFTRLKASPAGGRMARRICADSAWVRYRHRAVTRSISTVSVVNARGDVVAADGIANLRRC